MVGMASVTRARKFPVGLTIVIVIALGIVGLLAVQWVTSLVWTLVRFVLILVAFYAIFRIGMYLLRNGGSRPD